LRRKKNFSLEGEVGSLTLKFDEWLKVEQLLEAEGERSTKTGSSVHFGNEGGTWDAKKQKRGNSDRTKQQAQSHSSRKRPEA